MKFIVFAIALMLSFNGFSQKVTFKLKQNGKNIKQEAGILRLEKDDFDIEISFDKNVSQIYLNLTYDDLYYNAKDNKIAPEVENLLFYKIAESGFNTYEKIYVDPEAFHYLGPKYIVKGKERHDFSKLVETSKKSIGTRKVSFFDDRKNSFSINEINKPLYLYVIGLQKDKNSKNGLENLKNENVCFRLHSKIDWK
jgi:hypothetical protein